MSIGTATRALTRASWRWPPNGMGAREGGETDGCQRIEHLSVEKRKAHGKDAREEVPPSSHAGWTPAADRPDPVALLEEQDASREPDLVPVRHGRMMVSPFTFYRGAAKIMAADLKYTPRAGLPRNSAATRTCRTSVCSPRPSGNLLFDLNDFDETLPGPFEYDVKRMSASFTIAARNNGFTKAEARDATLASVSAYRTAMAEFAEMGTMDVWYAHLSEQQLMAAIESVAARRRRRKGAEEGGEGGGEERRRRPLRRLTRATACRRCRSSASSWTAGTGSSASRRSSSRRATARDLRHLGRRAPARDP